MNNLIHVLSLVYLLACLELISRCLIIRNIFGTMLTQCLDNVGHRVRGTLVWGEFNALSVHD